MFITPVEIPNAVAPARAPGWKTVRPGRRHPSSTAEAPMRRNTATADGDNRSNNPTARAAPTYIEVPPSTNRTGAGTRGPDRVAAHHTTTHGSPNGELVNLIPIAAPQPGTASFTS